MKHLSELLKNEEATIQDFDHAAISDSQITELLELGFYPGAKVLCLEVYHSLNKMLFLLGGTKVGLRFSDCHSILIKI